MPNCVPDFIHISLMYLIQGRCPRRCAERMRSKLQINNIQQLQLYREEVDYQF